MTESKPRAPGIDPAATVMLLRAAPLGLEVLLMQRASELAVHGGAWVFPGGRVDAVEAAESDAMLAAMRAAVRETHEESGLSIVREALVPFSHWTTPEGRARRFATWFFITEVSAALEAVADGKEMLSHRWMRPAEALAQHAERKLELPPPTFVSLSVLSRYACAAEALGHARREPPRMFAPRLRASAEGPVALYLGDVAYEQGDLEQAGPRHRLCMYPGGWRYHAP